MNEKYERLQKLHEWTQYDFPWYKGEYPTELNRQFANEAYDIIPELLDRLNQAEEALKNSSCPSCGYAWEAKLWIKKYDENNQKS